MTSPALLALVAALARQPLVKAEARHAEVPARTLAAIEVHEARGRSDAVGGRDGQCVGLGQICLHTVAACRTETGYDFDAPACQAEKARLLDPAHNLHVAASALRSWRALCIRETGRAPLAGVLAGYGGAQPRGTFCGQRRTRRGWRTVAAPRVVREILDLARKP